MNVALIDVSYWFWMSWHSTQGNAADAARRVIQKIRTLRVRYDRVIACCDLGESFRKALYPDYKGERPDHPPAGIAQLRDLRKGLHEHCQVAMADGYEGDDIIATLAAWAQKNDAIEAVHIHSADKDLYQCVGGKVTLVRQLKDGEEMRDGRWVHEYMGCTPDRVPQWLTLVGDKSDNLPGVPGIGEKKAFELLKKYGDIDHILKAAYENELTPAMATALVAHDEKNLLNQVEALATLKTDAPINCEEIMSEFKEPEQQKPETVEAEVVEEKTEPKPAALVPVVMRRNEGPWSQQLEPSGMEEAFRLAKAMHQSGLFAGTHRNEQSAMAIMYAGRELGVPAIAALRGFHVIATRDKTVICPSAHLLVGICLRFDECKYFEIREFGPERVTWATKRGDRPEVTNTWTLQQANDAGLTGRDVWKRYTRNMLSARASSELARLVYPDVVMNTYAAEEMSGGVESDEIIAKIQREAG